MKQLPILLGMILLLIGCGQKDDTAELAAESTEVESTPFILEAALTQAKAENKPILLEFTGSDWCPPCKALEKEILGTAEFKQYASTNLIFGKLDFPNRKQQSDEVKKNNAALSEKYNISAFPTLVLLKGDGTELWRQEGYGGGNPKEFISQLEAKAKAK